MLVGERKDISRGSQWGFIIEKTTIGFDLYSWDDCKPEELWGSFNTIEEAETEADKYW